MDIEERLYLKFNVKMEPLIWHWYAWSYLILLATASSNLKASKIYAEAAKNPAERVFGKKELFI